MSLVVAVIPSFRPIPGPLEALVSTLTAAGAPLVVSDDASPCTADPILRVAEESGATVIRHRTNRGVARGLNDGLRVASQSGARWLLTIDQDTDLPDGYVTAVLDAADRAERLLGPGILGAIGAGRIDDVSGPLTYPLIASDPIPLTHELIQTGTVWSVPGLLDIGGFDESFGIDAVDAAACVRLRATGRRIALAPDLSLAHRLGEGRQVRVLGRSVLASDHSPDRRTTIVRNRLRLAPEEARQSPVHAFRSLRRTAMGTLLAVTVEDDRWAKAKGSIRGLLPRRDR